MTITFLTFDKDHNLLNEYSYTSKVNENSSSRCKILRDKYINSKMISLLHKYDSATEVVVNPFGWFMVV